MPRKSSRATVPKLKRGIPFAFVIERLASRNPVTRPMFGAHGVYIDDGKMVFILRERESYPDDNGVWIATKAEHHESLLRELPCMRGIGIFGPGPTNWRCLPLSAPDFENCVERACELVLRGDERIGTYPSQKKSRAKPKKKVPTKKRAPRSRAAAR
jgi:hypothetical protein